jgi:hypothetical protein
MIDRPGGEPLWHVIDDPAIFVSTCVWPEISLNRRLPGTFQRVLGLLARRVFGTPDELTLVRVLRTKRFFVSQFPDEQELVPTDILRSKS